MANNFTDYTEKKVMDHIHGVAAFTMPAALYLVLFTADPTDAGVLTNEVSGSTGYIRKQVSFTATTSGPGTSSNTADIVFPAATSAYTVTHIGYSDSATIGAGNLLSAGPLSTQQLVAIGNEFKIGLNKLSETLG